VFGQGKLENQIDAMDFVSKEKKHKKNKRLVVFV
jgi:hypothetical protein